MPAGCYGSGERFRDHTVCTQLCCWSKWSRRTVFGGSQASTRALETAFALVELPQIFRAHTRLQGTVTDVATRHKKILWTALLHKTQIIKAILRRFCKYCLLICFCSLILCNLRQNAKDSYQFFRTELLYRSMQVYINTHLSGFSYSYYLVITKPVITDI